MYVVKSIHQHLYCHACCSCRANNFHTPCRKSCTSNHHQMLLLHKVGGFCELWHSARSLSDQSTNMQTQSLKKAKQFELRKLIRRLKAAAAASPAGNAVHDHIKFLPILQLLRSWDATALAAGTESAATETEAAVSNKLQAQYDITKTLETDVLLQQVTQFVHKALCLASQRSGQCLWLKSHIQTCHNKHRSHASMQPLVKH